MPYAAAFYFNRSGKFQIECAKYALDLDQMMLERGLAHTSNAPASITKADAGRDASGISAIFSQHYIALAGVCQNCRREKASAEASPALYMPTDRFMME